MTLFTDKTKVFVSIIASLLVILLGSISNLTSTFAEQSGSPVSSISSPYDFCVEPGQLNLAHVPICDHTIPTPTIIYNPCFYPVQSSNPAPSSCVYTSNSAPCYISSVPLPNCNNSSSNGSSVISSSSSVTSNSSSSDKNPKNSSSSSNSSPNSSNQSYSSTSTSSSETSQNSTLPNSFSSSLPISQNSSTSSSFSSIQGVLDYSASSNSRPQGGGGLLAQTGMNIALFAFTLFSVLSFVILLIAFRAQSQTQPRT